MRKTDTNQLYAMKTLRKTDILKRNQFAHVKAERDILAEADNEWVVKLYYSFQDEKNLYLVMDYIPGGDLMALLIKKGFFEESFAKFYIAELVLAIESVHALRLVFLLFDCSQNFYFALVRLLTPLKLHSQRHQTGQHSDRSGRTYQIDRYFLRIQ